MAIHQLAANALNQSKPTKRDAQKMIEALYKLQPDELEMLSALYKYFMPARPAKPKTLFDWCAMVTAKDNARYGGSLCYVKVTEQYMYGLDGRILHRAANREEREPGIYTVNGDKVMEEHDGFPDCERVITPYEHCEKAIACTVKELYSNAFTDSLTKNIHIRLPGVSQSDDPCCTFDLAQLQQCCALFEENQHLIIGWRPHAALRIESKAYDPPVTAVIMPWQDRKKAG